MFAKSLLGNGVVSMVKRWPKTRASNSVGLQINTMQKLKRIFGILYFQLTTTKF